MKTSKGIEHFFNCQRLNVKKKGGSFRIYKFIIDNFQKYFGRIDLSSITAEGILAFMTDCQKERNSPRKDYDSRPCESSLTKALQDRKGGPFPNP
jgi:hypothetical protein